MASNLISMASNIDGLQPNSDGLQPRSNGLKPLHLSALNGCLEVVESLLEARARQDPPMLTAGRLGIWQLWMQAEIS